METKEIEIAIKSFFRENIKILEISELSHIITVYIELNDLEMTEQGIQYLYSFRINKLNNQAIFHFNKLRIEEFKK